MKYWFMSYAFRVAVSGSEPRFGCIVITDGEHPVAKVMRWNLEYRERITILLFWQEITKEEAEGAGSFGKEL